MSYKPRPGSVDLWIFGATDIGGTQGRPTVSPNSVRAQNSRPISATTAPAPAAPTTAAPGVGKPPAAGNPPVVGVPGGGNLPPGVPPTGAPVPVPPGSTPTAPVATAAGTVPPGLPSASPTGTPDGPRILDAAPTRTASRTDSGSALPALITVGLLALLAATGGVVAWRRRRT
ncbi:hypothetical protein GCM10027614_19420 [Micromonospora vulcania]